MIRRRMFIVDIAPIYKPGDPRPEGYVDFFEWADVQLKASIKQEFCHTCKRWYFPQEPHCRGAA